MAGQPLLRLEGVNKAFPGVQALKDVSLAIMPGEIHALVGENGAGKSTLIKIISGVYHSDQGQLYFQEQPVTINSPREARELGISTVYQELALSPHLSVAENIFMGRLPARWGRRWVDWNRLYNMARELLDELEIDLDPRQRLGSLSVAYRQQVEIARALSINARVIIFDEPTAVLTEDETAVLFKNLQRLKERGVGVIYISHRMAEILHLADRITVLRDGRVVATLPGAEAQYEQLVRLMVGRDINKGLVSPGEAARGNVVMEVEGLCQEGVVADINFSLHAGEVLGLYGLVGSGRTEVARLLFGLARPSAGKIKLAGKEVKITSPREAIRHGLGFLPEDRRHQGLVLQLDVTRNICLANLDSLHRRGFIQTTVEKQMAGRGVKELAIKTPNLAQKVANLSGGNQQKVILARWLMRQPKPQIFIMDEPTRGVDVGAKAEIHRLIRQLADEGMAVLMISSDLSEVLAVSDRIMVMREGRMAGEIQQKEATEEKVIFLATHDFRQVH
ncbi:sugar ABC transporter ATP-binding protein [Moorella naiadis]|uniref:sugar ABC transporter ATP-binding protein n=1 Tax=Moorella naiadis (nom. illeg.) TaxID=3093670 RepID=UPI003D9CA28C